MSLPLRRAGTLAEPDGRTVVWSVAEGRRGSRWRWAVRDVGGTLVVAHTLELDPDGRFVRLEAAGGAGLLTLHHEPDGSVHGNRVTAAGIDHLAFPEPAPRQALVGSGTLGTAALVRGFGPSAGSGVLDILEILDDLEVRVSRCSVGRRDGGQWEIRTSRGVWRAAIDSSGMPAAAGASSTSWPLERG